MMLLPGDALVYEPSSVFGWLISVKTGHSLSHVEIYLGSGQSFASRDGVGTGIYPVRLSQLEYVCRPHDHFDADAARAWFAQVGHQAYGWRDLAWFFDLPVPKRWSEGIVCSPAAAECWKAGGVKAFNDHERPERIAPYEFTVVGDVDVLPYTPGVMLV